jgi:hypothetical protein
MTGVHRKVHGLELVAFLLVKQMHKDTSISNLVIKITDLLPLIFVHLKLCFDRSLRQ